MRSTIRAADDRLGHMNLLASGVLSLLRTTAGGLGVEPTLPASLRSAIHELTAALGARAEDTQAGASEAVAGAARAARLAGRGQHGPDTHALLITEIIRACVRDLYRVVGAEPD